MNWWLFKAINRSHEFLLRTYDFPLDSSGIESLLWFHEFLLLLLATNSCQRMTHGCTGKNIAFMEWNGNAERSFHDVNRSLCAIKFMHKIERTSERKRNVFHSNNSLLGMTTATLCCVNCVYWWVFPFDVETTQKKNKTLKNQMCTFNHV